MALAALGPLLLSACASTQDKSARLARSGAHAISGQKGLSITRRAAGVKVAERVVLHDQNGVAVALVLRNAGAKPLFKVPVGITVTGASGRAVFRNDAPGLDASLTSLAVLQARGTSVWVNDQVDAASTPRGVRAEVGAPRRGRPPGSVPDIALSGLRVADDPSSGIEAVGRASLRSGPPQENLVVYCIARRGGRIVAAGRSIVPRLTAKKPARFHVFFIGDPRRARLAVSAPPTVL